jgi:uncharacterized protein YndB with AHSA1/START domain
MMRKGVAIQRSVTVQAPPMTVFQFLTVPANLQEWLCHRAVGGVAPGSSLVLFWSPGWTASAKCVQLKAPEVVALTWRGDGDPAETRVEFALEKARAGSHVLLSHSGMRASKEWKQPVAEMEKGWDRSLENLKSVIETGIDLRIARRPFLGIGFEDVTPERAEREKLPVHPGIRITEVVPDSGAAKAGLQRNDIMIEIGKRAIANGAGLLSALEAHSAGETVDIRIYRNRKPRKVKATLSARKITEIPPTHKEAVAALRKARDPLIKELDGLLKGVSEEAAEKKPAPEKWSAKEVLAHLVLTEQYFRTFMVCGFAGATLEFTENITAFPETIAGVLRVNPTLKSLRNRLKAEQDETLAVLEALREDYRNHRANHRRVVSQLLEYPEHTRHHFKQLTLALQGKPLK